MYNKFFGKFFDKKKMKQNKMVRESKTVKRHRVRKNNNYYNRTRAFLFLPDDRS